METKTKARLENRESEKDLKFIHLHDIHQHKGPSHKVVGLYYGDRMVYKFIDGVVV